MIMVDDIFQQEAEDDLKTIEFIRNYLPTEVKERFSDKDGNFDDELIQYFLDVIWEYYYNTFSDTDDEVEIDTEAVAKHVVKIAKKEKRQAMPAFLQCFRLSDSDRTGQADSLNPSLICLRLHNQLSSGLHDRYLHGSACRQCLPSPDSCAAASACRFPDHSSAFPDINQRCHAPFRFFPLQKADRRSREFSSHRP